MATIEIFKNDSFGEVRVAGTSEQPLFCLADVCRVLELQTGATKNRLDEKGISLINTPTNGGIQQLVYINEKNLYKVIMRSDKPQAEPFQDWVCGEVLPSIRKTGQYSVQQHFQIPQSFSEALQLAADQARKIEEQKKQIEEDAPRVLFSKAVETAKRSCLIAELAKILQQNGINIGQNRLFKWLRKHGYLCSKGQYYNQPTQKSVEMGLFEIKQTTINKPDGTVMVSTTTKCTGKGQIYFVNKFLSMETIMMEAKEKKTTEGIINQDVVNMLVKLQELRQIYYSQIENLRRINLECDYIPLKHDFDSAYVDMYAAIEAMLGETTRLNIQGV